MFQFYMGRQFNFYYQLQTVTFPLLIVLQVRIIARILVKDVSYASISSQLNTIVYLQNYMDYILYKNKDLTADNLQCMKHVYQLFRCVKIGLCIKHQCMYEFRGEENVCISWRTKIKCPVRRKARTQSDLMQRIADGKVLLTAYSKRRTATEDHSYLSTPPLCALSHPAACL